MFSRSELESKNLKIANKYEFMARSFRTSALLANKKATKAKLHESAGRSRILQGKVFIITKHYAAAKSAFEAAKNEFEAILKVKEITQDERAQLLKLVELSSNLADHASEKLKDKK